MIFQIPTPSLYFSPDRQQRDPQIPRYTLKWKLGQLLVSLEQNLAHPYIRSPKNEEWLVECLKRSPVRLVRIDPALGKANLSLWVSACQQASKAAYLHLPTASTSRRKCCLYWWRLKRLVDWSTAALLLLILSPIVLGLVCFMHIYLPGPVFSRQWCVGERGKLFQQFKFCTTSTIQTFEQMVGDRRSLLRSKDAVYVTLLGHWMCKSNLDRLPQLFNVLRGEMSLVGAHPWSLANAVELSPQERQQLNALPGIIGPLQSKPKLNLLDLDAINQCNQKYLSSWSLWQDLKILILAIRTVLVGT